MIGVYPSTVTVPHKSGMNAGSAILITVVVLGVLAYVDYNYTHYVLNKKPKEAKPLA